MTTICTITWPDHSTVTALMKSRDSGETAAVTYSGAVEKLTDAPPETDSMILQAYMENQADLHGGVLTTDRGGNMWEPMDEVVS